jgi:ubiquinone/menaquinone biosynthesis C-methylase UbiE
MIWQRYIDGQYRQPSGVVGRWIGGKMAKQHQPENLWTVNLLRVQPSDHVLEVGFGPGIAIQEVARRARLVSGVDVSRTMVAAARRRNAAAVRDRQVDLRRGDAAKLPFADDTFDKAFSIHSIYFWRDPLAALGEIRRVLKPHGMVVLTVLPKERWNPGNPDAPVGTPDCTPYTGEELCDMLAKVGFTHVMIEDDPEQKVPSNFSVIGLK